MGLTYINKVQWKIKFIRKPFFPFFLFFLSFLLYIKIIIIKKTIIGFEDLMLQSKLLYRVAFPLPVQLQCHIIETNNDKHIFD